MIGFKKYLFLILVVFAFACQRQKEARIIPVEDFFKSQSRVGYRLSPDGKNLSYLKLEGKNRNIYVEDIETGKGKSITHLEGMNIVFYFWVSNNELIYYKEIDAATNQSDIFIVDMDHRYPGNIKAGALHNIILKSRIQVMMLFHRSTAFNFIGMPVFTLPYQDVY